MTNYSNATYQCAGSSIIASRPPRTYLQTNYTFSKNLSDTAGDGIEPLRAVLDNNNAGIEKFTDY